MNDKTKAFAPRLLDQKEIVRDYVRLADLNVDPSYQRKLYESRLSKITTNFDPDLIQTIVVSKRADGTLWVLDGQHRCEVLRRLGKSVVLADIREGLTHEREAILFWMLNSGSSQPTSWEQFMARITGNEPIATAIVSIVERHGYHIGRITEDRGIQAVGAVETVYNMGKLDKTMAIISTVWPMDKGAREASIIQGLGQFLLTYDGDPIYDDGRTLEALDKVTPSALLRRAKETELETGRSFQRAATVTIAFRDCYNGLMTRGARPKHKLEGAPIIRWTKTRRVRPTGG